MSQPSDPPAKTIIITGISPHSPLSRDLANSLISSLQNPEPPSSISIALLGPSSQHLKGVVSTLQSNLLSKNLTILDLEVDLTSPQSIAIASHTIRSTLGAWDIFIHNAPAHLPLQSPVLNTTIRGADEDDWWSIFEVNIRSLHFVARHFFPKAKGGARFVNVLGAPGRREVQAQAQRQVDGKMSASNASALAAEEVVRYLDAENETVGCSSVYVKQIGEVGEMERESDLQRIMRLLVE